MRRQSTARGMAGDGLVPQRRLQHRHARHLGRLGLRHQAEGQVRCCTVRHVLRCV